MKHLSFLLLLTVGLAYSVPSKAQFFKKLKNKVSNAISTLETDDQSQNTNSETQSGNNETSHSFHPFQSSADEKNNEPVIVPMDDSMFFAKGIYSLLPGEILDFSESCLGVCMNNFSPRLGIKNGTDYYVVANGKKTQVPTYVVDCKSCSTSGNFTYVNKVLSNKTVTDDTLFAKYFEGYPSQFFIKFNGKKYGPYFTIADFKINKNHTKFLALVTTMNTDALDSNLDQDNSGMYDVYKNYKLILIGSGRKPVEIAHTPDGEIISNDDLNAFLVLYNDFSKGNNPERMVFNPQTGKSEKPPHENSTIYRPTADFVCLYSDAVKDIFNEFYMNGKLIKTFPHKNYSYRMEEKDIFISPANHSHWAAFNGSYLFFSDGKIAGSVISPHLLNKDGSWQMYWLTLSSDNKTVTVCHEKI